MTRSTFGYMADVLELDVARTERNGKPGFVSLFDAKTKQVGERLSCEQNLKQMSVVMRKTVRMAP